MTTTTKFNSHAILVTHYCTEIGKWNWNELLTKAKSNMQADEWGDKYGQAWLGTTFGILVIKLGMTPTGKIYTGRSNIRRDEAFYEALDTVATAKGGWVTWEDDSCFFQLQPLDCASTPKDEMDDAACFDTNE